MQGINHVIIMGRLGRDPELRQTGSGRALCRFRLAVNRSWRSGDSWTEETDWIETVLWEERAERANRRLAKGDMVLVQGRISARSWQDKDGQWQNKTEVVGQRWSLVSSPRHPAAPPEQQAEPPRPTAAMPDGMEAQPF